MGKGELLKESSISGTVTAQVLLRSGTTIFPIDEVCAKLGDDLRV